MSLSSIKLNYTSGKDYASTTLIFFTDGSCTGNGKLNSNGGYASICVIGPTKWKNLKLYGKLDDKVVKSSNIRAEGTAILVTLEYLHKKIKSPEWSKAYIHTDSQFWKDMIENYMPTWTEAKFALKANPDLTKKIWRVWNALIIKKDIGIVFVPAHNKHNTANSTDLYKKFNYDNNQAADILANIARELPNYTLQTSQ